MGIHVVLLLAVLSAPSEARSAPGRVELQAEAWFNSLSIRVPEDRTYVLFFFSTVQEREAKPWIEKLNKINRREDTVVIGLSAESKERVSKYVEQQKVQFAVGAKSKAYKKFSIKQFPQVLVLSPKRRSGDIAPETIDLERLDRRFAPPAEVGPLTSGAFDEDSPLDLLRRHAREDSEDKLRALGLLRKRIPPEEFMEFCDQLLEEEENFFRRGDVLFQRQLADPSIPESEKEPLLPPSSEARRLSRENPDDAQWVPVRDYVEGADERTAEQLFQDYLDHPGDNPADVMIRRNIPDYLARTPDKQRARELLMQMLPMEPDAATRMGIAFSFANEVCQPGDFEVADFLEQQLQTEKNVRTARPAMEYVIRYLRTGEE